MSEIRNLTRNGETFYPLTHEKAVIGMDEFKETITEQVENYKPIEITGNVTNAPDEEDITADSNNLLKFKNRNNLYGLGKVILRRGSSFASQVTLQNTIYVIQYNFDLNNERIILPNGAILLFEGGSVNNGTLVGNGNRLVYYQELSEIMTDLTIEGTFVYKACDKDTTGSISVDNSSIEENELGQLTVKAGGIQNTHLNGSIVDQVGLVLDSNNKISIKADGTVSQIIGNMKGVANGIASLDSTGKVPSSQLPSSPVPDNIALLGDDDGQAVIPGFDPQTDTLHKAAQVLTTAEKDQVAQNLNNRPSTNGMARIELKATDDFKSVVEAQTGGNTVFVIKYDFTLTDDMTVPANCVLQFDGGSISGEHTITGNNTDINAGLVKIFNTDITLAGSWNVIEVYPEWFGAKGDYNYNTGIGTDDSDAVSKAIKVANLTYVNKVRLSSAYYIDDTVDIESGDILIEGSYVTIREDLAFAGANNDVSQNKKSILVAGANCTTIVTIGSDVTHPIWFKNVGIFNYNIYDRTFNVTGIKFASSFVGPVWPFVVEYCHFYGLDKAIYFTNEDLLYLVNDVKIRNCSFNYNTWCVFFDEFSDDNYNYCWRFEFTDNHCHENTFVINMGISNDAAVINDNNMEGDRSTLPNGSSIPAEYSDYAVVNIRYRLYSKLEYKRNHHEQNKKKLLTLIGRNSSTLKLEAEENFFNISAADKYIVTAKSTNTSSEAFAPSISVENIDFNKFVIKDSISVKTNKLSNIYFVEKNIFARIYFNEIDPDVSICDFTSDKSTILDTNALHFVGNELYSEHLASDIYVINPYTLENPSNNNYLIMFAKARGSVVASMGSLSYGGANNMKLYNSPEYKYVAVVRNCPADDSNQYYFYGHSNNADILIAFMGARILKTSLEVPLSHMLYGIGSGLSLPSTSLSKIATKSIGNSIFLSDTKKPAYWNGTAWVDATGATV